MNEKNNYEGKMIYMNEKDDIKEVEVIGAYRKSIYSPVSPLKVGSIIYTDGIIVGDIEEETKDIEKLFVTKYVSSKNVNLLKTKKLKLKNANYVITVYYKEQWLNFKSGCGGGFQKIIVDWKLDMINKDNRIALKEAKKTLSLIKSHYLLRNLYKLENGKSSLLYNNDTDSDVYQLMNSKYSSKEKVLTKKI